MAFNESDIPGHIADAEIKIDELTDSAFLLYERSKDITYYTDKVEDILKLLEAIDVRVALSDSKDVEHILSCLIKTADLDAAGAELTTLTIMGGNFALTS